MVGWHHWLNGHEFEHVQGDSEGQGRLAYCSPWGHKESDMTVTEQQQSHLWASWVARWHRICIQCRMTKGKWKLLSCVQLFVTPMDYNQPGSSVHGILQARILEWVDYPFSSLSSWSRIWTGISCIAVDSLPAELPWKQFRILGFNTGSRRSLEEGIKTHLCILAWRIPWTVQLSTHTHISPNA